MKLHKILKNYQLQAGFTLVELLLFMAIFSVLVGLVTINLLNAKQSASLSTTVSNFLTDLKQQQLRAMIGDTGGRASTDSYGISFGTTKYTLFHGTAPQGDSSDLAVNLGESMQFVTNASTFPNSKIVFLKGSGEVSGFTSGQNAIIIKDVTNNNQKTITVNRYGVVTSVN